MPWRKKKAEPQRRQSNGARYELQMVHPNGLPYPMVRMKHPQADLYYRHGDDVTPWVSTGYTTWSRAEWFEKFAGQDFDGRIWEFFGEPIELWPPGSEEEDKGGNPTQEKKL